MVTMSGFKEFFRLPWSLGRWYREEVAQHTLDREAADRAFALSRDRHIDRMRKLNRGVVTLKIYKNTGFKQWYIDDELGTQKVSVRLKGNSWSLICDPEYPPDLKLEIFGQTIQVMLDDDAETIIGVEYWTKPDTTVGSQSRKSIIIPEGHPAVGFFVKTGKNSQGIERTVPITHSLDHQQYGVKVDAA